MKYAALGFAVATASWLTTGMGHAQQNQDQGDHWNWHGRVAAGKTIEIRGINGSITADQSNGSEVVVTADKRGRDDDPGEVRIAVVESEDGVTICAVYPGRSNECRPGGGRMNVRDNDVEVNFTVHVPRGVQFDGNTVTGDVDVEALDAPVSANTVNGSVQLETATGQARAHTVNGGIQATLHGNAGTAPLDFETVNGSVTLTMPAGVNADFSAETVNGSIASDFPIQVMGRMNPRSLHGQIGTGGRELRVHTVNGSVRLRRLGSQ